MVFHLVLFQYKMITIRFTNIWVDIYTIEYSIVIK